MTRWAPALLLIGASACSESASVADPLESARLGKTPSGGFTIYSTKGATDVVTTPTGGVYLAGGGTDLDAGMVWLMARGGTRSGGGYGDVVVLRTSGSNGYNTYLQRLGANSVTSIVITSRAGADAPEVLNAISRAEVLFLAGGDQSTYVNLWRNTQLQARVNARIAAGVPIGGTSAGLAVLGQYVYSAQNVSTTSAMALANPFDASITLEPALFTVPLLTNVITDSHFAIRDRMGRLLTFLARLQQDGMASAPKAIGVDEGTGVGVIPGGTTTTFGSASGAYYLSVASGASRTCAANTPLTYSPVSAFRVRTGNAFNVSTWTGSTPAYSYSVSNGVVSSSTGAIY
jgi:cyanophycinase